MPDDPGVCYDPDTAEGQAALWAYQERRAEQLRQADAAWARKYPGVEFPRLSDRLRFTRPEAAGGETTVPGAGPGAAVSSEEVFPNLEERPRLLLGVRPEWLSRDVQPGQDRTWRQVRHQSGGVNCTQVELVATELTPRPEREAGLLRLSLRFYGSNLGGWGTTVDDLVTYRAALRELLGVDCNVSYGDLREAVYPVDVTPEHLRHLTSDELPADLDELLVFGNPTVQVMGMLNRWRLWIITQNSD